MKKFCILLLSSFGLLQAQANVRLPRLISDGMVLQRDVPVKIWGWATPGEKVTLHLKKSAIPNRYKYGRQMADTATPPTGRRPLYSSH